MRPDALRQLADDFAAFQLGVDETEDSLSGPESRLPVPELRSAEPDPVERPGRWLLGTLGIALTAVGLAYRSGPATVRYLSVIDTRSLNEMSEWDGRIARGWLRRNIAAVGSDYRTLALGLLEGDADWSEDKWAAIVRSLDVTSFGFWGPGDIATTERLERVMAVFVLGRLVAMDLGSRAAFSFMVGSNPWLGGTSPLLHVANSGSRGMELALTAADNYLAWR